MNVVLGWFELANVASIMYSVRESDGDGSVGVETNDRVGAKPGCAKFGLHVRVAQEDLLVDLEVMGNLFLFACRSR
jgi:hypothetical protein